MSFHIYSDSTSISVDTEMLHSYHTIAINNEIHHLLVPDSKKNISFLQNDTNTLNMPLDIFN